MKIRYFRRESTWLLGLASLLGYVGRTGEAGWPARLGAAEDVDLVVDEDLDVVGLRVQLLDELRHVRGGRAVAAFQAVEDDVLSGRVVRVADPECVRARRQRRQQAKRRLYRGAVRDLGYRRVVGGDERAHLVRRGVPDVVDRELEGERDRDRRHHRGAVPRGGYPGRRPELAGASDRRLASRTLDAAPPGHHLGGRDEQDRHRGGVVMPVSLTVEG